jgi:hypothetical protein
LRCIDRNGVEDQSCRGQVARLTCGNGGAHAPPSPNLSTAPTAPLPSPSESGPNNSEPRRFNECGLRPMLTRATNVG